MRKTKRFEVEVELTVIVTVPVFQDTRPKAENEAMGLAKRFIDNAIEGKEYDKGKPSNHPRGITAQALHFHRGTTSYVREK